MAIKAIKEACKFNGSEATIVLEGATVDEVNSGEAKGLAMKIAMELGAPARGISGSSGPYMVNESGDEVTTLEEAKKAGKAKFRNEYRVATMIGFPFSLGA